MLPLSFNPWRMKYGYIMNDRMTYDRTTQLSYQLYHSQSLIDLVFITLISRNPSSLEVWLR